MNLNTNPSPATRTGGYLLDMDGVLYRGQTPIPHAAAFIQRLQEKAIPFLLVTNHSCLTPQGFAAKLAKMGLSVPADRFYSSALASAEWLRAEGVSRVFMLGEEGLFQALAANGIVIADKEVSHVVVGLDRALTYEKLTVATRLILAGARFIGTNPDPVYPVEDGDAPECGLLLGALQNTTGQASMLVGKPAPIIYRQAAQRLGVPLEALTMVGDRLDTDIAGARGVGMRSILVLTGSTQREDLAGSTVQPDEVREDLRDLEA